jgi:hypothetical protein
MHGIAVAHQQDLFVVHHDTFSAVGSQLRELSDASGSRGHGRFLADGGMTNGSAGGARRASARRAATRLSGRRTPMVQQSMCPNARACTSAVSSPVTLWRTAEVR